MNKFLYGIDFGTTNSALSIYDYDKKEVVATILIPSLIYFPADQKPTEPIRYMVGENATKAYLEEGMKGRFMKSIKRVLPRSSFVDTRVHHQIYTAPDLVALILKELKAKADAIIGYPCERAVLGRPVYFDENNAQNDGLAQKRLLKAAQLAGFTDLHFQFEPIGAAFAYERTLTKKEKVLVADLGGGTTDYTLINLDPSKSVEKDRKSDILATGGIYVGGDSFDSAFMWEKGTPYFGRGVTYESMPGKSMEVPLVFFSNICSWEKLSFFNGLKASLDLKKYYSLTKQNHKIKNLITLAENNLGYSVFQSIEKTKIELSGNEKSLFQYHKMEIEIEEEIRGVEYNEIIGKEVSRIAASLEAFLSSNQLQASSIDTVFLTGGTSLVPVVRRVFEEKFPQVALASGDNFISVATGLAYSTYLFD